MFKDERGIALVMALFIILFSTLLTVVLAGIAIINIKLNANIAGHKKAVYAAEAGREYAKALINDCEYEVMEEIESVTLLNGSSFNVQIKNYDIDSDTCVIESSGKYFASNCIFKTDIKTNRE